MILGFDCSGAGASAALYNEENGSVAASETLTDAGTHSVTLLPMIKRVLALAGITADGISSVAVTTGPGSFTGVRIGVALAKGLAMPKNLPCVGLSALLAASMNAAGHSHVLAVTDARRGRFYNASFDLSAALPVRLCDDDVLPFEEIAARIPDGAAVTGEGASLFSELCARSFPDKRLTLFPCGINAENICRLAAVSQTVTPDLLLPVYLRMSQAERERSESGKQS